MTMYYFYRNPDKPALSQAIMDDGVIVAFTSYATQQNLSTTFEEVGRSQEKRVVRLNGYAANRDKWPGWAYSND